MEARVQAGLPLHPSAWSSAVTAAGAGGAAPHLVQAEQRGGLYAVRTGGTVIITGCLFLWLGPEQGPEPHAG